MKNGWVVKLCALHMIAFFAFQGCSSAGSAQRPAAGGEYEVYDREKVIRRDSLLVQKYASILETNPSLVEQSFALYAFIDKQLNTPCRNKPGENSTSDVHLTQQIFNHVYNRKVPASYDELIKSPLIPKFSDGSYLEEGDLIFFEHQASDSFSGRQKHPEVKTVGIYLLNNKFIICSGKAGAVVVNDLEDRYWEMRYRMAGRLK